MSVIFIFRGSARFILRVVVAIVVKFFQFDLRLNKFFAFHFE